MNKTAKKALKITGIVFASIIGAVLLLYAVLWIIRSIMYKESMDIRQYVCDIPEINSGFVPQGITYSEETDTYIMTGYDGKNTTMLYLVKDNKATRIDITDGDGEPLAGHGGGVTCAKDFVYISSGSALVTYSLDALKNAGGGKVAPIGIKNVDNSASFCFSDGSRLFVGEFYRAGNYETDKSHYFTTPDGTENRAIVSCYPIDSTGAITTVYPDYCISITGLVQGFAVSGSTYILSRSYGLANSKLEYYTVPTLAEVQMTVTFKNDKTIPETQVPLYYLSQPKRTVTLPPFSEDLTVIGDRVIVTNEAACNKYFIGKLFGSTKVYSYPVDL